MSGQLPSVGLSDLYKLPASPAIYFVQQHGRVVYVGQTKNLHSRWLSHHRQPQLIEREGITLSWLVLPSTEGILELEEFFIQNLKTELNGSPMPENAGKTFLSREEYALMNGLHGLLRERDTAIDATHPTFSCRCDKCGSYKVYVDSDAGRSDESGAWGGVFMQCAECGNRTDLWDNF